MTAATHGPTGMHCIRALACITHGVAARCLPALATSLATPPMVNHLNHSNLGQKPNLGAWACSPIPAFKQQEQRALPTSPHRSSTTRKIWRRRRLPAAAAPEAIAVRTASSIFPRQWRLTKLFMSPLFFFPLPSVPSDHCLPQYCKCVCCIRQYATGRMSRRSLAALL
jgi:hypothetical protein